MHISPFLFTKVLRNTSVFNERVNYSSSFFGLSAAPTIFTKLLKVPISLMRKLNVKVIIFLDDMLLKQEQWRSVNEREKLRETLIFILQNLGLLINIKKFAIVLNREFLGLQIDSREMILNYRRKK